MYISDCLCAFSLWSNTDIFAILCVCLSQNFSVQLFSFSFKTKIRVWNNYYWKGNLLFYNLIPYTYMLHTGKKLLAWLPKIIAFPVGRKVKQTVESPTNTQINVPIFLVPTSTARSTEATKEGRGWRSSGMKISFGWGKQSWSGKHVSSCTTQNCLHLWFICTCCKANLLLHQCKLPK